MEPLISLKYVVSSVVFSLIGLVILWFAFWVFDKLTPGELWKEIIEEHNMALAIVVGSMTIGVSIIIALAIHG
ncbi:MAG: DUF350 domain-containing protein [Nitrospinae bacterium]|nr:DUF350 domain-containing protein [Nitrospinota bacterium]